MTWTLIVTLPRRCSMLPAMFIAANNVQATVFYSPRISGSLCILANYNIRVTIYFGGFLLCYFLSNRCNFDFEVINHVSTIINKLYTH